MGQENPGSRDQSKVYGMAAHECRTMAVEAVHTRPYLLIEPRRVLTQLVFMNDGDRDRDRVTIAEISERIGVAITDQDSPFHGLTWEQGKLHCEKHNEFSSYLWSAPLHTEFDGPLGDNPFRDGFVPPGPVLCAIRLLVLPWNDENAKKIDLFDPVSLCKSSVEDGKAEIATDFRQDNEGLIHILVLDRGLTPTSLGALIQRLMEIETYRTLAVLGGPLSRTLLPRIRESENRLMVIAEEMRTSARTNSEKLLTELTDLSAELEADSAAILFRFAASRAYYEIVQDRLSELGEVHAEGCTSWRNFLERQIAPAMQTCQSVEQRLAELTKKLGDAISLLSSWIDVQLESQNSELLASMNDRARLQLQLQQTVEGLSVAAISYYVIGLLGYFLKGIPGIYNVVEPELAITALIPVVIFTIWWTVRRIRHSHSENRPKEQ